MADSPGESDNVITGGVKGRLTAVHKVVEEKGGKIKE